MLKGCQVVAAGDVIPTSFSITPFFVVTSTPSSGIICETRHIRNTNTVPTQGDAPPCTSDVTKLVKNSHLSNANFKFQNLSMLSYKHLFHHSEFNALLYVN